MLDSDPYAAFSSPVDSSAPSADTASSPGASDNAAYPNATVSHDATGRLVLDTGPKDAPAAPAPLHAASDPYDAISSPVAAPAPAEPTTQPAPDEDAPDTSLMHDLAVGAKGAGEGLADLADMTNPFKGIVSLLGLPTNQESLDKIATHFGFGDAETAGQHILQAATRGAASAGPLGIEKGLASAGLAALSGTAAGAAGEGTKQEGYGAPAQLAASLLAGGGVGGLAAGAKSLVDAFGPRTLTPLAQSFENLKVPPLAADVGGVASRMATGAANMTLGGIPLADAARKSVAAAKNALTGIAERIGTPFREPNGAADNIGAGLAAQRGVRATLGAGGTKEAVESRLWNSIPVRPDFSAVVTNTRQSLQNILEGLPSNPELSKIWAENPRLQRTLDALKPKTSPMMAGSPGGTAVKQVGTHLEGGTLAWQDLKHLRSIVGRIIGQPSLSSDGDQLASLRGLYAGLSEDMQATATNAKALPQFLRANTYTRALESRRDQILKALLGNKMDASGADAFRQIEQWSTHSGDVFALGRALRSMPEQQANDIRATIFDRLGTVSKGRQDETGTVFSPNDFITHWNGLSGRAKSVLFPGAEYRESIDDLVRVASAQKGAQQFANVSKTGNAVNGITLLTTFFHNPLGALPVALGQLGFGKLMASPKFAKWLASAPTKPNASAALAHINRLGTIAAAEPTIANEVHQLQIRLASAFTAPPLAAAADNGDNR